MILWDREGAPPPEGEVLRWRDHAGDSVPAYLEANAERLRAKYLAFIHDLGESRVAGKRVVDHLAFDGEFSFWWMTRLAEKSPFKSPGIYAALRLMALEELLLERRPARLELAGGDAELDEALSALCRNLAIEYARLPGGGNGRSAPGAVPHPFRGLFAFTRLVLTRRGLSRFDIPGWFSGSSSVFICSFFAQLDADACERGEFVSHYWGPLPGRLREGRRRVNWLHHYLHGFGPEAPDAKTSLEWLDRFNEDARRQGLHAFLESYLTWGVAFRAGILWLRLNAAALTMRSIEPAFSPKGSAVELWPVLRHDWLTSLAGSVGALNCLWFELFDAALKDIPPQKTGLYLCENQAWEPALIRAWRRHGHGELIGVAHATVPYWHLYYLEDPRIFKPSRKAGKPSPDRLAVNGAAAARILREAGHPVERLVEVEALRYLDLPRLSSKGSEGTGKRVLIIGDVLPESMRSLLSNLEAAARLLPADYRFTFKPHPIFDVDLALYPGLRAERATEPLAKIMGGFDAAVAGNSTSGAVDAHLAGLPVVIGLDGSELNLSPLRGEKGARFAGTPEALAAALLEAGPVSARDDFFHLDPELPRWRELLKLAVQ